EKAASAIEIVVKGLAAVAMWLGKHPGLVAAVGEAFVTWKAVKVISGVVGGLKTMTAMLGTSIPAAAGTAATAIGGLIGPITTAAIAAEALIRMSNALTNNRSNIDPRKNPAGGWGTLFGVLGGPLKSLFGGDSNPPAGSTPGTGAGSQVAPVG